MRLVVCCDFPRRRLDPLRGERVDARAHQREVLDPLRAEVRGDLGRRHAPELLGVGLEEVPVQPPAEARHEESLEVGLVLRWADPGRAVRARCNAPPRRGRGSAARSSARAGSRRACRGTGSGSCAGRARNSSAPRISNQRSSTGVTLVKNRWPPMSKRHPSRSTVRLIPPTTESASRTVAVAPALESMYAAVRPAGPAPMITTDSGAATLVPSLHQERSGPRRYRVPGDRRAPANPTHRTPSPNLVSRSRIEAGETHELVEIVVRAHKRLVLAPRSREVVEDLLALVVERPVPGRPDQPDLVIAGALQQALRVVVRDSPRRSGPRSRPSRRTAATRSSGTSTGRARVARATAARHRARAGPGSSPRRRPSPRLAVIWSATSEACVRFVTTLRAPPMNPTSTMNVRSA